MPNIILNRKYKMMVKNNLFVVEGLKDYKKKIESSIDE